MLGTCLLGREVLVRDLAGSMCCVPGQNSSLSKCLSPSRSSSEQSGRPNEVRWIDKGEGEGEGEGQGQGGVILLR